MTLIFGCKFPLLSKMVSPKLVQFPLTFLSSSLTKSLLKMDSNCLHVWLLFAPRADLIAPLKSSRWSWLNLYPSKKVKGPFITRSGLDCCEKSYKSSFHSARNNFFSISFSLYQTVFFPQNQMRGNVLSKEVTLKKVTNLLLLLAFDFGGNNSISI